MSSKRKEKTYSWLKLQEDFFDDPRIRKMESIAGGDKYVKIYLKMLVASIKSGGVLEFEGYDENIPKELSFRIREEVTDIEFLFAYLENVGLMEIHTGEKAVLPEAVANIGSETEAARRMRKLRRERNTNSLKNDELKLIE